jgi:hypothetical protein
MALVLLVLTLLFMSRVLLPEFGQALGGHDVRGLFYPWLEQARQALRQGDLPLWDAQQFAGYPFMSNPQLALFYPPTWLALVFPVNWGISWYVAWHIWWSGLGMLLFARYMRSNSLGAFLAAIAFAFSGFTAARIWAGHIGLLATDSWLPWILLTLAWSVRRESVWAGVLAGLPLGFAILAGHTTSLIYIGLAWLLFAMYLGLTGSHWLLVGRQLLLACVSGLAFSAVQLLPLLQFSWVSSRATDATYEFASAYSLPPAHLITLLMPAFFGQPERIGYWSVPNFEELTYYVGVLPLLGLVLALGKPSRLTWFFVGLMLTGVLMAFGSYGFLFPLSYSLLPPLRLARAPARAAVLFTFASSALLAESISIWQRQTDETRRVFLSKLMRWMFLVSIVAGTVALAATAAIFAAQHPAETSGRLWHQLNGWVTLLTVTLAGIVLFRRLLLERSRHAFIGSGLLLLLLIDLWSFGFDLVRLESMDPHPMWADAKRILGDSDARVLPWGVSVFDQNGAGQVGLSSVFGYNALEIGANAAFAASVPDPRSTAYDVLGAGYVLSYVPLDQFSDGQRPLELVDHTDHVWLYRRGRSLPLARLVFRAEVIEDAVAATARIHEPGFDPQAIVILERATDCQLPASRPKPGTARVVEQRDGYWRIETDSSTPALLVLSETSYPGWKVTVSGMPADAITAYSTIRAVCIPAGKHTVVWEYSASIYLVGGAITLLTLLVLGIAVFRIRETE